MPKMKNCIQSCKNFNKYNIRGESEHIKTDLNLNCPIYFLEILENFKCSVSNTVKPLLKAAHQIITASTLMGAK